MIIFCNSKNEIKAVGSTTDSALTRHEIDDECNPFNGMSEAKICCYKATVIGGRVNMMTPYVDSKLLEHIDQLGSDSEENTAEIADAREGIIEAFDGTLTNASEIADCREALMELFDIVMGSTEEE